MIIFFYAALMTLVYLGLSVLVILDRGRAKVAIGDGGDTHLQAQIRVHGNFAEYVPMGILLIFFTEMSNALPAWAIHTLALTLLVGRIWHYYALTSPEGLVKRIPFRIAGMVMTFLVLGVSALALLWVGYLYMVG